MYRAALSAALLLIFGLSGCATLPNGKPDPRDRYERFNRSVYKFNNALDHAVLRPVARAYVKLPQPIRSGINNFFTNFTYPTTVANDLFQGKFTDGVTDSARIVVNTTLGIGGLFDPASRMGLEQHTQDFGLTLGHWGVPTGPFIELPFLGPSDVRDTLGLIPDYAINYEISHALINNNWISGGLFVVSTVNKRSQLLDLDKVLDQAYDPYAFTRNAYLQRRDYLVHGDESPEAEFPDAQLDDSSTAPKSAAPPGESTQTPASPGTAR
ncbi:MAG TPA: VacJ family lipoprotein [Steroidobacteraceae bacterium]|jgi:phospholipid-binding lipoprotein MlaA|nr:VacJ family lipoprotein [Steroidobacteraceae bacterium]